MVSDVKIQQNKIVFCIYRLSDLADTFRSEKSTRLVQTMYLKVTKQQERCLEAVK